VSKSHNIRYLGTAQKDLIAIFEYIRKDNPAAAILQLERFDKSISQFELNPLIGVIPNDERLKKLGY